MYSEKIFYLDDYVNSSFTAACYTQVPLIIVYRGIIDIL